MFHKGYRYWFSITKQWCVRLRWRSDICFWKQTQTLYWVLKDQLGKTQVQEINPKVGKQFLLASSFLPALDLNSHCYYWIGPGSTRYSLANIFGIVCRCLCTCSSIEMKKNEASASVSVQSPQVHFFSIPFWSLAKRACCWRSPYFVERATCLMLSNS